MNILLGSHGTGKSSLLKVFSEKHPEYFVTDGFSRPVKKVSKTIELTDINQQILINELTCWAYNNYLTKEKFFCTRSIIDCIIHSELLFPTLDVSELYKEFEETEDKIGKIFYLPIEFEVEDDGVRYNKKLQKEIDDKILLFCKKYLKKEVIILTGSIENRVKIIENALNII